MSSTRFSFQRRFSVAGSGSPVKGSLAVEPPGVAPRSRPVGQVVAFFAITYLVTWGCFVAGSLMGASGVTLAVILLGSFAPSVVAVVLTGRLEGRSGVRALLRRLLQWRVGLRWYVFALAFMAVVKLLVAVIYRVGNGDWPQFGDQAWYAIVAAILPIAIVGGPLGEEVGWRGFALPRLSERWGLAPASLLLGVVWACWHLPLFFLPHLEKYTDQHGQSFPTYFLQVVALSVALAWLMGNTGGSLLLAVLMHSAINQTKDIVPSKVIGADNSWALSSSTVAWLTVALLWVAAAYFLSRMQARARVAADPVIPAGPVLPA
jgi:membrane protease YdiL (CAAX protease family)